MNVHARILGASRPACVHNVRLMKHAQMELAALAARWIVEDGLEYGSAKQRAAKLSGTKSRTALPSNDQLEEAVADYIALFCADTQPAELLALRILALLWMERLAAFRPYIGGAVWRGIATRKSDIYLQLFCDDCKSAELALIDQRVTYLNHSTIGFTGAPVQTLSVGVFCPEFKEEIGLHLMIHDRDDLRGALKPDSKGRTPRGNSTALRRLLSQEHP